MHRTPHRLHTSPTPLGFGIAMILMGCAGQPRESGRLSEPSAKTSTLPQVSAPPSLMVSPPPAPIEEKKAGPQAATAPTSPAENSENRAGKAPALRARGGASVAQSPRTSSPQGAPKAARAKAPAEAGAARDSEAASEVAEDWVHEARPAYAEPPELMRAIADFDSQWEAFSTSRACEDACRAWQSMKRSAERICALVVDGDPRERCPTAKARLDQATRELTSRCNNCK